MLHNPLAINCNLNNQYARSDAKLHKTIKTNPKSANAADIAATIFVLKPQNHCQFLMVNNSNDQSNGNQRISDDRVRKQKKDKRTR